MTGAAARSFLMFALAACAVAAPAVADDVDADLAGYVGTWSGTVACESGDIPVQFHIDLQNKNADRLSGMAAIAAVRVPPGKPRNFRSEPRLRYELRGQRKEDDSLIMGSSGGEVPMLGTLPPGWNGKEFLWLSFKLDPISQSNQLTGTINGRRNGGCKTFTVNRSTDFAAFANAYTDRPHYIARRDGKLLRTRGSPGWCAANMTVDMVHADGTEIPRTATPAFMKTFREVFAGPLRAHCPRGQTVSISHYWEENYLNPDRWSARFAGRLDAGTFTAELNPRAPTSRIIVNGQIVRASRDNMEGLYLASPMGLFHLRGAIETGGGDYEKVIVETSPFLAGRNFVPGETLGTGTVDLQAQRMRYSDNSVNNKVLQKCGNIPLRGEYRLRTVPSPDKKPMPDVWVTNGAGQCAVQRIDLISCTVHDCGTRWKPDDQAVLVRGLARAQEAWNALPKMPAREETVTWTWIPYNGKGYHESGSGNCGPNLSAAECDINRLVIDLWWR